MNSDQQVKRVVISCDHAGFDLKERIKQNLKETGISVIDMGPSTAESVDYPDMIHPLAKAIDKGEYELGYIVRSVAFSSSLIPTEISTT